MHDVIVIGCGPTGLVTALLLAQKGHNIGLVERHAAPYPLPRAITYDHEIARVFNALGLTEVLQPITAEPGIYQWRNQVGDLLFELDWKNGTSISGFSHSYLFSQPQLETILEDMAQRDPRITHYRSTDAIHILEDQSAVTVTARQHGDKEIKIEGQWLVGADGANSLTRNSIGSSFEDLGFKADWLVVDVIPRVGSSLPFDDDLMLQVCDPARPTTVVSGGPGRRRWEFMALEGETLSSLNSAEKAWELLRPWSVTPDVAELERHAVYTFRGAVADCWRKSRIFIAGDAAHLTPPFAGQGLCAGVRDAAAIAWRLDLALKGLATESLLNSYQSERSAHARTWIMNAIELGKVICVLDPAKAAERDHEMISSLEAGRAPPSSSILPKLGPGIGNVKQHGGTLAAGNIVAAAHKRGHMDDIVGNRFVLLRKAGCQIEPLTEFNRAILNAVGGISVSIGNAGDVQDVTGEYMRWFDELDSDVALIRPDFYLIGADKGELSANNMLEILSKFINYGSTDKLFI